MFLRFFAKSVRPGFLAPRPSVRRAAAVFQPGSPRFSSPAALGFPALQSSVFQPCGPRFSKMVKKFSFGKQNRDFGKHFVIFEQPEHKEREKLPIKRVLMVKEGSKKKNMEEKRRRFSEKGKKFSFRKQNRDFGKPRREKDDTIKGKEKNVRKISEDHGSGASAGREF